LNELAAGNTHQKHDSNFVMMGQVYTNLQNYEEAVQLYLEALEFAPDNPEILTMVGLMYLRLGETYKAFDFLGNALTHNPRDAKTILAAGSIIQDNQDVDVALVKYRIAAQVTPRSPELWNNIGMCFFGKRKYVACVACLKKAFFIDPFQWIVCFNLGLVHLCMEQYASAFHYLNATINLKPDWAQSYCFLAVALNRLDDFSNARAAYERAIHLDANDHVTRLNYAIMLCKRGKTEAALQQWAVFASLWQHVEADEADADIAAAANALKQELRA
jgi:Bardet-Biedl syndrome 4 protein